jgi:hypothetical protein
MKKSSLMIALALATMFAAQNAGAIPFFKKHNHQQTASNNKHHHKHHKKTTVGSTIVSPANS